MTKTGTGHPLEAELADYLSGSLKARDKEKISCHLADCPDCLGRVVLAYDSVKEFRKDEERNKRKGGFMKGINIYLILAVMTFLLSFITPAYFLQFLVATLILGAKWVVDSKTTKMLVMIHEAFKSGGEKEASRILDRLGSYK